MLARLGFPVWLVSILSLTTVLALAADPPEKALKYHEALLKRPHNASLFDRFFGAWLDEQPVESLGQYLKTRAEQNGGQDWTVLALFEMRQGREEAALAALGKAIEALPDDPALPMDRAKLRMRRLEFEAARTDLTRVAAGKDETLAREAGKLIGRAWMREGKSAEAIKAWDAVLAAHPDDEDLLEDLVEAAATESETAQALVYAGKLIAVSKDPYQKTLRMLRRGDLLSNAGRNDEAVEAYSATLEQVGEGSWLEREVLGQIEKVFRKQDRLDELSAQLRKLAETYPRRLLIQRQLAKLEATQGETDSAIGRFREVLKRSPGERELREEFVRLLSDGERFDEAVEELGKLIEQAPTEAGLQLQVAALRARQSKRDEVLAALGKAHDLLGHNEGNGIRIAGLMLQYGLNDQGEAMLKELGSAPGAGPAAMEALAAHYARTTRKAEAIEVLKKLSAGGDLELLLRTSSAMAALGENNSAYERLVSRVEAFGADARFVVALGQSAMAAGKAAEVVPQMLKLVRQAKQSGEISESVGLALRVVHAGGKTDELRSSLTAQPQRTPGETCLLAALLEDHSDFEGVAKLLGAQTDPQVIHFHAALLDRRGEFEAAVAVMMKLATTDEGRKAGYFKDLAELQQRAGKTDDALATVEKWKQNAPGDKAAWITGSQLLRQGGKPAEAVKMTRQAVARFEGDADLAASLASLHDEAGQWPDAEAIYWRLYDEAQSPADQARWAAQLSRVAQRTGKTTELEEKFRERARGNRKSIGPVLAQAELARLLNDEDKRRDLLLEAVRLQPKDVDLRLQIATLEEQAGNPERVVALLEEALPNDVNGRVRSALAQAYLRQGQTMKGMRELLSLAGKGGSDPRSVESAVTSLIQSGSFEDAIRYLREVLPDGGDWRSRYLLAVLLERDGREAEAQPIFLSLLNAQGEIASLARPGSAPDSSERYPQEMRNIIRLISAVQTAYPRNQGGRINNPASGSKAIELPDSVEDVRQASMVHLCRLAKKSGAAQKDSILPQLKAAGVADADFIMAMVEMMQDEDFDLKGLLERFPDAPGLFELSVMYTREPLAKPLIAKLLAQGAKLSPGTRFLAHLRLAEGEPADSPAWTALMESVRTACAEKEWNVRFSVAMSLVEKLADSSIPEIHRPAVRKSVLEVFGNTSPQAGMPADQIAYYRLSAVAVAGTLPDWIEATNSILRLKGASSQRMGMGALSRAFQQDAFDSNKLPKFEHLTFRSLPGWLLEVLQSDDEEEPAAGKPDLGAELFKARDKLDSPLLRAWLSIRMNDQAAIRESLAVTPSPEEATDFQLLKACLALKEQKPAEAYAILDQIRLSGSSDPAFNEWLLVSLLAVAAEIPESQRAPMAESFKALLLQSRILLGPKGAEALVEQAKKLGLAELATRLVPPTTTPPAGNRSRVPGRFGSLIPGGSSSSSPLERLTKLVLEKKHDAAAVEALRLIKAGRGSSSYSSESPAKVIEILAVDDRAALLKLVEPGDSKSLTKRLDYVDICLDLKRKDLALGVLESLYAERPEDPEIACRLAFNLSSDKKDQQRKLMTRAAGSKEFAAFASAAAEAVGNADDANAYLAFFDMITGWLETAEPAAIRGPNLGWVGYHAKQFYDSNYSMSLPPLMEGPFSTRDQALSNRRTDIAKRLAFAMIRHSDLAEEGFRLLSAARAWHYEPVELDVHARRALLAAADPSGRTNQRGGVFSTGGSMFRYSMGSSTTLDEFGTLAWIASRLSSVVDPTDILPPAYQEELRLVNPGLAKLVLSMAEMKQVSELPELLKDCGSLDAVSPSMMQALQGAIILRSAALPGSSAHFLEELRKLPESRPNQNLNESTTLLMRGAIVSGLKGKDSELEAVCVELGKVLFGPSVNWAKPADAMKARLGLNYMESLIESGFDAVSSARLRRALFRLGLPVGDSKDDGMSAFRGLQFKSEVEAERFFEQIGWLVDAADWSPFGVHFVESDFNGGKEFVFTQQTELQVEELLEALRLDSIRKPLVQRLKDRKSGRFGALMTAAALSEGKERQALAGQAVREAGASLGKVPKTRIAEWSLVSAWIPREAIAALPAASRELLAGPEERELKARIAEAEALLAKPDAGIDGNALFKAITPLVRKIAPRDLDKAFAIFIAADRRFTAGLSKGGKLSTTTADNFQLTERDQALIDLLDDSDSVLTTDRNLGLRFLHKLITSPDGGRFAYVAESSEFRTPDLLTSLGGNLYHEAMGSGSNLMLQYERLMPMIQGMDEEVRDLASIGAFSYFSKPWSDLDADIAGRERKGVDNLRRTYPEIARFADVPPGVISYPNEKQEDRTLTTEALNKVLNDASIPDYPRMAFGISNATRRFQLLYDKATVEAIAGLFENYCRQDRSAVNYTSSCLFRDLGLCSLPLSRKPQIRRIHDAFWANVKRNQPGGHPEIPDEMKTGLLQVAAFCGDEEITRRLIDERGAEMVGDIRLIVPLLVSRQFGLVDRVLPNESQTYSYNPWYYYYHSEVEAALKEYLPTVADPVKRLRLDNALCALWHMQGPLAPLETRTEQLTRLAALAKIGYPKTPISQLQVLNELITDDALIGFEFEDKTIEWSKARPFQAVVNDWVSQRMPPGVTMSPDDYFTLQYVLSNRAAIRAMGSGDVSLLRSQQQIAALANPRGSANTRIQVNQVTNMFYQAVLVMPYMVAQDRTKGFEAALPVYADLLELITTSKLEHRSESFIRGMALLRFLAEWTGHPEAYQDLLKKLPPNRQAEAAKFPAHEVLAKLPSSAGDSLEWKQKETLAPLRKEFLMKILSKKELAALLPVDGRWVKSLEADFPAGEFAKLTETSSPDWIPEVRPVLDWYQARLLKEAGRADDSAARFRTGIAAAEGEPFDKPRGVAKLDLAELLASSEKAEEARQILTSITPAETSDPIKGRLKTLKEKLSVTDEAKPK